MSKSRGIFDRKIDEIPIAIVDFETTGLMAGVDRVIEVSVVRVSPGREPTLALDTLVNPRRPVAATEIHGITDSDVAQAPRFSDIAGELVAALEECVVGAYNVYFDIKFLSYELSQAGVDQIPPHFCLMYMRPLLGLGSRCRLDEACRANDIEYEATHVAAQDAQACTLLLERYIEILHERGISTFSDLAALKNYKFFKSFENSPLQDPGFYNLKGCDRLCSRSEEVGIMPVDESRHALSEYWDALRAAVADLEITDEEMVHVAEERIRLGLKKEKVRVLHARIFENAISQFVDDEWLDEEEVKKLHRLHNCLAKLGWAPGQ